MNGRYGDEGVFVRRFRKRSRADGAGNDQYLKAFAYRRDFASRPERRAARLMAASP